MNSTISLDSPAGIATPDIAPEYYMNPATGSIDTLDGWYPYGVADGLVQVTRDAHGDWVAV